MRRILALTALVIGVLAVGAAPAGAVTGNFQDDNVHTYVGLIAFYDASDQFTHRCSGTLITPSVFLTAGHCTDATTGATHARLWSSRTRESGSIQPRGRLHRAAIPPPAM